MALVEDSLSTTTLQDWQPGAAQQNTAITRLCQQSNWALSSGGAWQWQHGSRIVNTGTIAQGSQFWPVVCLPFGGVSLRVSVYGQCSSGGSDQIGIYLSDSWPFGAGTQVGTLTIPGTAGVATATIDTQAYFGPVLIYLKAESDIDDLELQGFRGRLVGAEPDSDKLQPVQRYVQEKEFADNSPITSYMLNTILDVAWWMKAARGRGLLHLSLSEGQVRNADVFEQASLGETQVLVSGVWCRLALRARAYVRSYQQASDGDDTITILINGKQVDHAMATAGTQLQPVYEGWEYVDVDIYTADATALLDVIYTSDSDLNSGHTVQDISIITGSVS